MCNSDLKCGVSDDFMYLSPSRGYGYDFLHVKTSHIERLVPGRER